MTAEPVTVEPPPHPLPALTTYELRATGASSSTP